MHGPDGAWHRHESGMDLEGDVLMVQHIAIVGTSICHSKMSLLQQKQHSTTVFKTNDALCKINGMASLYQPYLDRGWGLMGWNFLPHPLNRLALTIPCLLHSMLAQSHCYAETMLCSSVGYDHSNRCNQLMTLWNLVSTHRIRDTSSIGRLYHPQQGQSPIQGGRDIHQ